MEVRRDRNMDVTPYVAEGVGFEPTEDHDGLTPLAEVPIKPLWHPSVDTRCATRRRNLWSGSTRCLVLVGKAGFEPATTRVRGEYADLTALLPVVPPERLERLLTGGVSIPQSHHVQWTLRG